MPDTSLDDFIVAAAAALGLPLDESWKPSVRANLEVTLKHAASVAEFKLPDDAEPAPLFKA
jgi:1-carboxybiuret hydrolase subunit AtzG-like